VQQVRREMTSSRSQSFRRHRGKGYFFPGHLPVAAAASEGTHGAARSAHCQCPILLHPPVVVSMSCTRRSTVDCGEWSTAQARTKPPLLPMRPTRETRRFLPDIDETPPQPELPPRPP
jgi:hypothetical protein